MKKLSKILVLVLAVALICTGLVLAVSADDTTVDLASAIDTAVADENGMTTVKLEGNATLATAYTVAKDLTIDLNGYTLASSAEVMFEVSGSVKFNIIGEGTINVDGMVFRTASGDAPTVSILGTAGTNGIDINHTGTASVRIAYVLGGTSTFKNLNVISTVSGGTQFDSFFMMEKSASATGAKMYFDEMYFKCDTVNANNPGQSVFQLSGKGYISIKNSQVYSTSTILVGGYSNAEKTTDTIVDVIDSTLYSNPKYSTARAYCMLFSTSDNWEQNADVKGIVNIKDSFVNGPYRVFVTGHTQASEGGNDLLINAVDSVIQCGGLNSSKDSGADFARGRKIKLTITGNSIYTSRSLAPTVNGSKLTAGNGVRTNSTSTPSFPSDGTYTVVYDPIGNKDYPYVVVKTHDSSGNAIEGALTSATYSVGDNNYLYITGFEDVRSKASQNLGGWFMQDGKSSGIDGSIASNSELGCKKGSLGESYVNGDTYLKYWVNPLDPNNPTEIRNFGTESTSDNDPFFVFGGNRPDDTKDHIGLKYRYASGDNRAKVVVFDMDFATDSYLGYSEFSIVINARKRYTPATADAAAVNGGSPYQNGYKIYFDNSGNISLQNGFVAAENHVTKLNDIGEWNHITAVCYTDPGVSEGRVYYYINGSYLGYSRIYKDNYCYIQGFRVDVRNDVNQQVGSSIIFDNLMVRAYADYIDTTKESDGTNAAGVHAPESYILDFMTAQKKGDVGTSIVAGGRTFDNLDDAFKYATEKNVNVKLNDSLFSQTVCENGQVFTNGNNIPVDPASYGFAVDGDKYTFNEDYWYNAYWYNGALKDVSEMADDANYVKEVVKLGFELDHENLFTEETKDFNLLQSVTQDGWSYDYLATEKVTALVPTLAELEVAKTDANRAVRFYPVITAIDMIYYIKNAEGTLYDGGVNLDVAIEALKTITANDTLVLLDNIVIDESVAISSTADAPKVLNVDLNGKTLSAGAAGTLFEIGAYTTMNVYSSVAGAQLISAVANASGTVTGGSTLFAITDGTKTDSGSYYFANDAIYANLGASRADVNEVYVNVGKFGDIPGSNMTLVADRLFYGHKGGENCVMISDGVNVMAPTASGTILDAYVFDGDLIFKNGIIFAPYKDNIVNATAFSSNSKLSGTRYAGFEDVTITSNLLLENVIIINNVAGISDGKTNNPVVSNNGDNKHVAITFKNVVTTGRLNPSNEIRNSMDGFVAAEIHACTGANPTAGTITAICNIPMTWQSIDLGITESVLAFNIPVYNADSKEFVNFKTFNIANNGASVEGLTNAYVLPVLTGATIYADDAVKVSWKGLGSNANAKTEYYVPGAAYVAITAPTAAEYKLNAVKLVHDGTWTGIPAAGTVMTENVNVVPGYKAESNISGLKANLSLYSDFVINVYIPENYAQYITSVNGAALAGDLVTIGENNYYKVTASKVAKEASDAAVFEIALEEGGYTATKTVSVSITDYASTILAGEFTDADKVLMYNMLSFADAAFKYFNDAEDDTIVSLLETYAAWNKVSVDKSYGNALADTGLGDVFTSAGIVLGDAPAFTLVPNGNFAGTVTVTYGDGNVRNYTVKAGSVEAIKIEGMKIFNFGVNVNITAVGTVAGVEQTVSGTLNLDTYAKYQTANAEENVVAIVEALYNYVKIAEQYKAGTLVLPEETPAE